MHRKLFLAVPCPVETQMSVRAMINELADLCPGVRWNREEDLHITLAFLGLTEDDRVGEIVESVRSVAATVDEFVIELDRIGAFPSNEEPVTLWSGVGDGTQQLNRLQRTVVEQIAALGFEPEERPYQAHLTLGRLIDAAGSGAVRSAVAMNKDRALGSLAASGVVLYSSEMADDGPRYEALATLPFGRR